MWIAVIFLICLCIVLIYNLAQKKQVDKKIEEQNQHLYEDNKKLIKTFNEYQVLIAQNKIKNDELISDINQHQSLLNNIINQNQEISEKAFREYCEVLETKYIDFEREIDEEARRLIEKIAQTREELDKIKATRAAAHQALLKEQEIKDNKDNYRLVVSDIEKRDIKILNSIKKELINERPVNMIIWQTYYSKRANELCAKILGTENKTGIYKITEISTDKCYIGQAKNIKDRFREHMKCGLGIDTPAGNKLYKAMLDSSIEDFTFELIEECDVSSLDEKEKYFISLYQSYDYGFNSNRGISNGKT